MFLPRRPLKTIKGWTMVYIESRNQLLTEIVGGGTKHTGNIRRVCFAEATTLMDLCYLYCYDEVTSGLFLSWPLLLPAKKAFQILCETQFKKRQGLNWNSSPFPLCVASRKNCAEAPFFVYFLNASCFEMFATFWMANHLCMKVLFEGWTFPKTGTSRYLFSACI